MSTAKFYILRKGVSGDFLAKVPNLETAFEGASTDLSCVPCVSVWTETGEHETSENECDERIEKKKGRK